MQIDCLRATLLEMKIIFKLLKGEKLRQEKPSFLGGKVVEDMKMTYLAFPVHLRKTVAAGLISCTNAVLFILRRLLSYCSLRAKSHSKWHNNIFQKTKHFPPHNLKKVNTMQFKLCTPVCSWAVKMAQ